MPLEDYKNVISTCATIVTIIQFLSGSDICRNIIKQGSTDSQGESVLKNIGLLCCVASIIFCISPLVSLREVLSYKVYCYIAISFNIVNVLRWRVVVPLWKHS
ncbi:hypothetical protein Avbf_03749 [Armadillidium vulgare]|nr:hypothetical protein Avbf_03749 [Armadillidium vulgare]